MLEQIAQSAAQIYAGKDWHTLNQEERKLVENLVQEGLLEETSNGFVGQKKK
jgi:hypothetical protein